MRLELGSARAVGVSDPEARATRKLREKAAEFEGMLIAQVLEKLEHCTRLEDGETDSAGESFKSLATAAVGGGLARSGGLGLGAMLLRSLQKTDSSARPGSAAAQGSSQN